MTTINLTTNSSSDAKRIRQLLVDLFPNEAMSIKVSGADVSVNTHTLIDALESASVEPIAVSSDQLTLW
jgi:hypothetical protein